MNLWDLLQRAFDEQAWREKKANEIGRETQGPTSDLVRDSFELRMLYNNPLLHQANNRAANQSKDYNYVLDLGTPAGFLEDYITNGVTNQRKEARNRLNSPL